MGQSEILAASLVGGFILYLAMQKRLAVYWSLMTGGTPSAPASSGAAPSTPDLVGQAAGQIGGALSHVLPIEDFAKLAPSAITDFLPGFVGGL